MSKNSLSQYIYIYCYFWPRNFLLASLLPSGFHRTLIRVPPQSSRVFHSLWCTRRGVGGAHRQWLQWRISWLKEVWKIQYPKGKKSDYGFGFIIRWQIKRLDHPDLDTKSSFELLPPGQLTRAKRSLPLCRWLLMELQDSQVEGFACTNVQILIY